jgi:hypothetical protein
MLKICSLGTLSGTAVSTWRSLLGLTVWSGVSRAYVLSFRDLLEAHPIPNLKFFGHADEKSDKAGEPPLKRHKGSPSDRGTRGPEKSTDPVPGPSNPELPPNRDPTGSPEPRKKTPESAPGPAAGQAPGHGPFQQAEASPGPNPEQIDPGTGFSTPDQTIEQPHEQLAPGPVPFFLHNSRQGTSITLQCRG